MTQDATTLHGVFLKIFDVGVLIRGEAACGKSTLALELVARGHQLVADDAPEFRIENGHLTGRCPPLLQDFLHVRGLGFLDIAAMYGRCAIGPPHRLDMILSLGIARSRTVMSEDLISGNRGSQQVLGRDVPDLRLCDAFQHRTVVLAEAAARDQELRQQGYHADRAFMTRQQRTLETGRRLICG